MAFGARNWATAAVLLAAVVVALSGVQARRWWPLGGELPRDETPYSISGRDAVSAAEEARRAAAVALGDLGSLSAHAGRLLNMLRGVPWHEFRPSFAGSEDAAGLWFAVEHRANATRSAAVLALSDASQYAANDINLVVNNQSVSGDPAYYDSQGTQLSASGLKLLHDVEQMKLLLRRGRLPPAMRGIAADMEAALVLLRRRGVATSMPAILYPREWVLLAGAYNRLLYQVPPEESDLPVGVPLLNDAVDWKAKDEEFVRTNSQLGGKTGIVIIDDFLSQEALAVVRRVVWENTAWFDVRERYMGAYYWSGLKTEILARIGLALMDRLPQTIGNHTLHQIWSYKYGRSDYETDALRWPQDLLDADARTGPNGTARGINIHADQAVINLNFWVTDNSCNDDPETGGMKVYRVAAPPEWDFRKYNSGDNAAERAAFVADAEMVRVPHRSNRVVVFHSSLLHETDVMSFKPGYKCRRVNLTFLYGVVDN